MSDEACDRQQPERWSFAADASPATKLPAMTPEEELRALSLFASDGARLSQCPCHGRRVYGPGACDDD